MKRLITAAAAAVLLISPAVVSAQEHMLEVKRYSDYAKDYLTITDAGLYFYTVEGQNYFSSYVIDEESILAINGSWYPWPGQAVTKINGQSTKGMSEEEFYAVLDGSPDSVTLCILDKEAGSADLTLYPIKEWPSVLSQCGITLLQIKNLKKNTPPRGMNQLARREAAYKKTDTYCTAMVDSDYDWFQAGT